MKNEFRQKKDRGGDEGTHTVETRRDRTVGMKMYTIWKKEEVFAQRSRHTHTERKREDATAEMQERYKLRKQDIISP